MATIGKTLFAHFRQVLHASAQYDQAITVFHRLKKRLEVSNLCSLSWDQTVTFSDLAHGLRQIYARSGKNLLACILSHPSRSETVKDVLFIRRKESTCAKQESSVMQQMTDRRGVFFWLHVTPPPWGCGTPSLGWGNFPS